ncbi:MAG: HupE/UreJ family protein [Mangrovimonas sp.]|nr:HupE/UreJ family protein [Mangrovimonas sp.]HPF96230.1 HupE/UreJ family protein [Mangrovimonas sp.]
MLDEFWFNVNHGINHVLDINGYDHVLFLMVLTVPYLFKDWKRVLFLVTTFTLGHTLSLVLAAFNVIRINVSWVEFLIPVTIILVAVFNVFTAGKSPQKNKIGVLFFSTLFFGLIHGLGFAREFQLMVGASDNKWAVLFEFAIGIEMAQVIIVFIVLIVSYIMQTVFRFSRRDWMLVVSSIVIGMAIPMVLERIP